MSPPGSEAPRDRRGGECQEEHQDDQIHPGPPRRLEDRPERGRPGLGLLRGRGPGGQREDRDAHRPPGDLPGVPPGRQHRPLLVPGCGVLVGRAAPGERAYYRRETLKKIAETQGAGAGSALEALRDQERYAARHRREAQKLGGLVTVAVGIGLMVFLRALGSDKPAYLLGLIPLLVGVALLAYSYLLAPKE